MKVMWLMYANSDLGKFGLRYFLDFNDFLTSSDNLLPLLLGILSSRYNFYALHM